MNGGEVGLLLCSFFGPFALRSVVACMRATTIIVVWCVDRLVRISMWGGNHRERGLQFPDRRQRGGKGLAILLRHSGE